MDVGKAASTHVFSDGLILLHIISLLLRLSPQILILICILSLQHVTTASHSLVAAVRSFASGGEGHCFNNSRLSARFVFVVIMYR